jgi:hypothetical protein
MKVKGLDGKLHNWKLVGHVPLGDDSRPRSQFHVNARNLLTKIFPADRILEEVPLPGSSGLTADFYIPSQKLMIEVHGEQHYKYVPHFHQNILGFFAAKKRDETKRRWCAINHIALVELNYKENIDEWHQRILSRGEISTT